MADAYGFTLNIDGWDMKPMLIEWHRADLPSPHEKWRNDVIEKIQGTRNPYIDGLLLE